MQTLRRLLSNTFHHSSALSGGAAGRLCSLALFLGSLAVAAAAPAPSFLHAQGQDIVNEQGQKVRLRGFGLGNWLLPEGYMWKFGSEGDRPRRIEKIVADLIGPENSKAFWSEFRSNYIAEADIQRLAELGYNSVRPSINSRLLLTDSTPPGYTGEGFAILDRLIGWCKTRGIYVILDMHGAPGGQTGQNIDDSAENQPNLFRDPKYQDQLLALWKTIALRYRDEPTVAGYDLLNEPLPERTGAARAYKAQLEPLYRRITQTIRAVDSRHMIILEGADWANDWSVFSHPFDSNLVYQFHYYCWDNPTQLKSIQKFLDYRNRFQAPVWAGETGERDNAIYWATTASFEANNIGWSFWPWKKMDTQNTPYSIRPPAQWKQIVDYTRAGPKPSKEIAQQAFAELLHNIRLENCDFFPQVVNAMLRRAPAKIEAENYDFQGFNQSYFVQATNQLSQYYRRTEPVPVSTMKGSPRQSGQYITLNQNEWTAYTISSEGASDFSLVCRAKATHGPAQVYVTLGDQTRSATISENSWSEINLGAIRLAPGANRLTCRVSSGVADLDWLDLTTPAPALSAR